MDSLIIFEFRCVSDVLVNSLYESLSVARTHSVRRPNLTSVSLIKRSMTNCNGNGSGGCCVVRANAPEEIDVFVQVFCRFL